MSRFVVLLLSFFISTAASDSAMATTTSASTATYRCNVDRPGEVSYIMNNLGDTLTVTPNTYQEKCQKSLIQDTFIRVNGTENMNYYILFTHTNLNPGQRVSILDDDWSILAVCEGDDDDGVQFCPPVILLKKSFILRLPYSQDVQVVIVATSPIPYGYYAYSQLPAWATVATVIVTFIFVFLMTLLCCCCLRMLCCRRRRETTVSSGHARCHRNIPDGPPVYSANPVIFDLPPIYVVREEAPVSPKTPQFN